LLETFIQTQRSLHSDLALYFSGPVFSCTLKKSNRSEVQLISEYWTNPKLYKALIQTGKDII